MASGLPVAAFPVTGPKDVVTDPRAGALQSDLGKAAVSALLLSGTAAREFALGFSWEVSAKAFRDNILRAHGLQAKETA
jgi:hypothetical protein